MNTYIQNSFILGNILKFLNYLLLKFKEGFIYNFFMRLSSLFTNLLDKSLIWGYFYREDKIDSLYADSLLLKILNSIFNFPVKLLRKLYFKFETCFEDSLLFKFLHFLDRNMIYILGLILSFTIIIPDHKWSNAYSLILIICYSLLFIFKAATDEKFYFDFKNIDFSLLVFMFSVFIAGILSLYPRYGLKDFIFYLLSFMTLLIIVSSIKDKKELNILIRFLIFSILLTSLYGIYQWKIVGIEVNPSLTDVNLNQGMSGRVFSTMGNPNIYGELLVLFLPLFIAGFLNSNSKLEKLFIFGSFILSVLILFKTGSRSAWVAFAGAIGLFVFFKNKKLLIPMIILGVLAFPFLPQSIHKRIMTIFNPNDSSLKYRKRIMMPAKAMLNKYWFTGVGIGTEVFNIIYKTYKPSDLLTVAHTHNLFMQIWLEAGLVALISLLWLGFRLVKKTIRLRNIKANTDLQNIAMALLAGIGGLMVMGFADHVWFYNRILFLSFVSIAIILSSFKLANIEKKEEA